jgi:hypothetical protein
MATWNLRGVNDRLAAMVKSQAALEGKTLVEWVTWVVAAQFPEEVVNGGNAKDLPIVSGVGVRGPGGARKSPGNTQLDSGAVDGSVPEDSSGQGAGEEAEPRSRVSLMEKYISMSPSEALAAMRRSRK